MTASEPAETLRNKLRRIDGKGYGYYGDIRGRYRFDTFVLHIDHVQKDPFASPSRVRVIVDAAAAGFPPDMWNTPSRRRGLCDYLTRAFCSVAGKQSGRSGSGKSGLIEMDLPGQEIFERTSVGISDAGVEGRFVVGLPARGRRIAAREAEKIIFDRLAECVAASLLLRAHDVTRLYHHINVAEDADVLRGALRERGLVAFVADGAILPRESGASDRPMKGGDVVAFSSPPDLRVTINVPNAGALTGMGIPRGVTLIVGGGYHGKSTLLAAITAGVYTHIPGDGREYVVSDPTAVKIRAEDGRRVEAVDISPFISGIPGGKDTRSFSSEDASGSTSQAANIMEALEGGASLFCIDEDTSATNFMIRDRRMQALIAKEHEPITPYIDRVRDLFTDHGVSSVIVIGGSGDYLDVADTVICMDAYHPYLVTDRAREVAADNPTGRERETSTPFPRSPGRVYDGRSFSPAKGKKAVRIMARGKGTIVFGVNDIDCTSVEQIASESQTRAIADAIWYAVRYMDGSATAAEVAERVMHDIEREGLDVLSKRKRGDYAAFRSLELLQAINRLRTLRARQMGE
ncbi:ABC-ATPase domain-containing protein [Methanogenium organophilum]|uniref:ABC-ATPase domain-containing protein n=1 Tax=Methanogenium organophilum TaxID=2199 RepID=A0A9X9S3S5_METOG|nr:ABC-ATPase domain-containing protein [Methanogenium organophilum]WAI01384.1 ABC-ATPase domain-containing protein [Methanogenium organophilum]